MIKEYLYQHILNIFLLSLILNLIINHFSKVFNFILKLTAYSSMNTQRSGAFRELAMTVQFNNYQEEITKNPTNNHRALLGKYFFIFPDV